MALAGRPHGSNHSRGVRGPSPLLGLTAGAGDGRVVPGKLELK
uniref:Uncharacterized protein n=1 Tax=viral metagenome TaxID=1070528 RepID=A0A6H1ZN79_9ZZZZ